MMKMEFTKKLIVTLILTILINGIFFTTINFADENKLSEFVSPIENSAYYKPKKLENSPATSKIVGTVAKWIRNVGTITGSLVLTLIGVKYMLAGGAEEKAQYKETMMPLAIGVVMLLGSLILITSIAALF